MFVLSVCPDRLGTTPLRSYRRKKTPKLCTLAVDHHYDASTVSCDGPPRDPPQATVDYELRSTSGTTHQRINGSLRRASCGGSAATSNGGGEPPPPAVNRS